MQVRIFQPSPSATQSGAGSRYWVLEFPRSERATPEHLMGWPSSGDTLQTIKLQFASKAEAIAYAEKAKLDYHVITRGARRQKIKGYADNFAYKIRQPWTH